LILLKYLVLVPDGCGDWKIPSLGNKTPLETADISNINRHAKIGETGLVKTVPDGMDPGSDVANIAVLGYDPSSCLTGRAPLEAAAMGIPMGDDDIAVRTNLVTLEGEGAYESLIIKDHSAGEIEDEDAEIFIKYIQDKLGDEDLRFYAGASYRCLLITKAAVSQNGSMTKAIPPHDILGKTIGGYLGHYNERMRGLMIKSHELLKNHPLNIERVKNGKSPANSVWFWGQGKKMSLPSHEEKFGIKGCMITAVPLLKGIGRSAGLTCPTIQGATGTLHTNYEGKAAAAIDAFKNGKDFVFIHVEAPDECSHCGDLEGKIQSLEFIDKRLFKTVSEYLENCGEPYRILILPDHMTPWEIRTHSPEPIPFVLYDSTDKKAPDESRAFSEVSGSLGSFFGSGAELANYFFRK
jgi:2,3-bisphosphoglycerate-independent phosphoglycerate mutase